MGSSVGIGTVDLEGTFMFTTFGLGVLEGLMKLGI
jgi:hypothetical protein